MINIIFFQHVDNNFTIIYSYIIYIHFGNQFLVGVQFCYLCLRFQALYIYQNYIFYKNIISICQQMDKNKSNQSQSSYSWASHLLLRIESQKKTKFISDCIFANKNNFNRCIVFVNNYQKGTELKNSLLKQFQPKAVEYVSGPFWLLENLKKLEQGILKVLIIQQSAAKGASQIPATVDFIINETIPQTQGELIFSCHKRDTNSDNKNIGVIVHLLTMKNHKVISFPPQPQEQTILNQFSKSHDVELKQLKLINEKYQINFEDYFRHAKLVKQQQVSQTKLNIISNQQQNIESEHNLTRRNQYSWATYLMIKTTPDYQASRCINYLKNSNYQSCIIYISTQKRTDFILKSISNNQIKNKMSLVNGSSKMINQYLQKLDSGELKALIIPKDVAIKQMKDCQIPNKVNLIICDFIPNSAEQFECMVNKSLDGQFLYKGVVINLFSEKETTSVLQSFSKKNGIIIENKPEKETNLQQYFDKIICQRKLNKKEEQKGQQEQTSKQLKLKNESAINNIEQQLKRKNQIVINVNCTDVNVQIQQVGNKKKDQGIIMRNNQASLQKEEKIEKKSQQLIEGDKSQPQLITKGENDKKQVEYLNPCNLKQTEKIQVPKEGESEKKIQQNIKQQKQALSENRRSGQQEESNHDYYAQQIKIQQNLGRAVQIKKQTQNKVQQQKSVNQFKEIIYKLQQNKSTLLNIEKCINQSKQHYSKSSQENSQIIKNTSNEAKQEIKRIVCIHQQKFDILTNKLQESSSKLTENLQTTKNVQNKLCNQLSDLILEIKNNGSELQSFRKENQDNHNKLQTKMEQLNTNQQTSNKNLFYKVQNEFKKSNIGILENKLKADETISKIAQVDKKVMSVNNTISDSIKTSTQTLTKQISELKKSAEEDKKQMNERFLQQTTKRNTIENQLLNMGAKVNKNQEEIEFKMKQMKISQDKQKQLYNQNVKKCKEKIDQLSKNLQTVTNEKKVLQGTKLQLLKEKIDVQGQLAKQKKKNEQLAADNNQLRQFKAKNENTLQTYKKDVEKLNANNILLKSSNQKAEAQLKSLKQEKELLQKQNSDTKQLLQQFNHLRQNSQGQKNMNNPLKPGVGISNQVIKAFKEQLQKMSVKDSVSKMIQECKDIDSFKSICTDLFKSMNQNAQNSWKKPFVQIPYYNQFTMKATESKSSNSQYAFKIIVKMAGQYDKLLDLNSKQRNYRVLIQDKIKSLYQKIEKLLKDGTACSIQKSVDYNYKDSNTNKQFQNICKIVNNLADSVRKLSQEKKQLLNTTQELKTRIASLISSVNKNQSIIRTITTNNSGLTEDVNRLSREVKAAEYKKKQLEEQLTASRTIIDERNVQIKSLESRKQELEIQLSKANRNYSDEKLRSKMAEQEIKNLKITMKKNEQTADKRIKQLQKQIQVLKKQTKDQIQQIKLECQQKLKQLNKKWQKILSDQQTANKDEKNEMLKNIDNLCQNVNNVVKKSFNIDLDMSINNYVTKLKQFQKNLSEIMTKKVFLVQSELYRRMNEQRKKFIYDQIKSLLPKKIVYTKTLFEGYPGTTWDHWLLKVGNKPNILMLLQLKNGFEIAGFSQNPFSKESFNQGKGFIMSVTNSKVYKLKKGYEGKVAKYDQYIFGMGNNELLVKNNFKFNIIISRAYCHFETANVENKQLIGEDNDEGEFDRVQFYQMILE